ncbi:polyisoprenoid-binding protein [Mycobacterium antarcticum]|uniref:YceI family protein n=1 Tax=unclassified Mycolicibacterium TaxID=2636767 RepID=UPI0023911B8D|nr:MULTISPECIES: YceI family protein [unclassified Mycolicibacterium]GLP75147.1 polyisoprenoid-binding protein [Mycolicibacterium sp. TUM20983]GLP80929.1 polyisoprenoid-binding protein [Mycolicibacterium sp. TUM20984]
MSSTSWTLDASLGQLFLHTGVAGRAARLGHDLTIAMNAWEAEVSWAGGKPTAVELTVEVSSLEVLEGHGGVKSLSGPEKAIVRSNALSALDVKRHPTIGFQSDDIEETGDGYRLVGSLDIHGTTTPRTIELHTEDLGDAWRVSCESVVRQSEFGVKPYSLFMGSLRVADDVTVSFTASWAKDD